MSMRSSGQTNNNNNNIDVSKVKTATGFISGYLSPVDDHIMIFKGVPYSSPPVGDLRWKEPQPAKRWKGVLDCTKFGPNPFQNEPTGDKGVYTSEFLIPQNSDISEDCLYLNIWSGAKSADEKRPVLVYIYGGAFFEGSGSVPMYDGLAMAKKGIVFITINYRLGVFGFFSAVELTQESPHKASGNYGILDQIAALKWVQKNIRQFGGDPDNVTIAGQSAGAFSVSALLASGLTKNLFHKAILESGGGFGSRTNMSLEDAEKEGQKLMASMGVSSLKALRKLPAKDLYPLSFKFTPKIITDHYVLTSDVETAIKENKRNIPVLTGFNADEAAYKPVTVPLFQEKLIGSVGKRGAEIFDSLYPVFNDKEAATALENLSTITSFGIQAFTLVRTLEENNDKNIYFYYFKRKIPENGDTHQWGAFHSGEVSYAYGNLKFFNRPFEKEDVALEKLINAYWVNFAKTGDPNGTGLPKWSAFSSEKGTAMIFDEYSHEMRHPFLDFLNYLYKEKQ